MGDVFLPLDEKTLIAHSGIGLWLYNYKGKRFIAKKVYVDYIQEVKSRRKYMTATSSQIDVVLNAIDRKDRSMPAVVKGLIERSLREEEEGSRAHNHVHITMMQHNIFDTRERLQRLLRDDSSLGQVGETVEIGSVKLADPTLYRNTNICTVHLLGLGKDNQKFLKCGNMLTLNGNYFSNPSQVELELAKNTPFPPPGEVPEFAFVRENDSDGRHNVAPRNSASAINSVRSKSVSNMEYNSSAYDSHTLAQNIHLPPTKNGSVPPPLRSNSALNSNNAAYPSSVSNTSAINGAHNAAYTNASYNNYLPKPPLNGRMRLSPLPETYYGKTPPLIGGKKIRRRTGKEACKWAATTRKVVIRSSRAPPKQRTVYKNSVTGELRIRKATTNAKDGSRKYKYVKF